MGWLPFLMDLPMESNINYPPAAASERFHRVQGQALVRQILNSLTGKSERLLSYDEVKELLLARGQIKMRDTQMIRLDRIVGSVGRYRDFDRFFLPLGGANAERWKNIDIALNRLEDLPPIEVYQLGEVYFVRDGNHRVSVALANGLSHIEAWVTVIDVPVELTREVQPDEMIIKIEYAHFLDQTDLNTLRPDASIELTEPGRYQQLLEHIHVHHYYLGLQQQHDVPYHEAVASWYDHVYLPNVQVIRDSGILKDFPKRTEADLYLWITYHRDRLRERYGTDIDLQMALTHFAQRHSERPLPRVVKAVTRTIRAAIEAATEAAAPPMPQSAEEVPALSFDDTELDPPREMILQ